jgi:hypothetical protein
MTRLMRRNASRALALLLATSARLAAQSWTPVPPADFSTLSAAQFADHELEVPYHLRHFATVANAVVESGTNRGFLDLRVNREPADNQPHNARVMENQLALAYFYTVDRPWNPYRGHAAVRVRLEAMLARWARIQNQPGAADGDFDGLFTEYSPTNWSLAPTSFGAMHAAEALDLIRTSGLPFDPAVLESARAALRAALMAMFTRADMRAHARDWSNQFSGSYHAGLAYLAHWPDAALETAFAQAVAAAADDDQSPAGFFYEQGGPDFGYSSVHENNLRVALPRLRLRATPLGIVAEQDIAWNDWLGATLVLQPGTVERTFLTTAGLNTRTSHAVQTPGSRPLAEWAENSRIFARTDTEQAAAVAARRTSLQAEFGRWGALAVPSAYSYIPSFVFGAVRPLDSWQPTAAQRAAAEAALPSLVAGDRNRQLHDALPLTVTTVKRADYYAVAATGRIRVTRQNLGLGLLWTPRFGVALQSVAEPLATAAWTWGTRRAGVSGGATYETADLAATVAVAGTNQTATAGMRDLPAGEVVVSYPLDAGGVRYGRKTLTFRPAQVEVAVEHTGAFTELLPLAHATDAVATTSGSRLTLTRPNGAVVVVEATSPGATLTVGGTTALTTGLVRRAVTVSASGQLTYRLAFAADAAPPPAPPPPPPPPAPAPATSGGGSGGGGGAVALPLAVLLALLLALRGCRGAGRTGPSA